MRTRHTSVNPLLWPGRSTPKRLRPTAIKVQLATLAVRTRRMVPTSLLRRPREGGGPGPRTRCWPILDARVPRVSGNQRIAPERILFRHSRESGNLRISSGCTGPPLSRGRRSGSLHDWITASFARMTEKMQVPCVGFEPPTRCICSKSAVEGAVQPEAGPASALRPKNAILIRQFRV
jgi:hypothetical protein